MRHAENKKKKDKVAVVLMLCFCLVALTSIFTIKASIDKVAKSAKDITVTKDAPTENSDNAKDNDSKETSKKVPTVDSQNQTPATMTFVSPLDMNACKISKEYSMDMVIYNLTLDQYMTHPGLDIEGPESTGVKAVAEGTVTNVYTDDAYGEAIEITHANGYISRYCNLGSKKLVEKGDVVKQGQVIGSIGNSAMYESMEAAHLHLEIIQDGKPCDPTKFIQF